MFTNNAMQIFNRSVEDYHRYDNVDHPEQNPFTEGSLDYLLYKKNWVDAVQWHLEDIIRDPNIDPVEARTDRKRRLPLGKLVYIISYKIRFVNSFRSFSVAKLRKI